MKANEPEKIYLQEPTKVRTEKKYDNDVEYTRTEVFINKAATWFANRYQANGSYLCADDIEDFIKTMKGE